MWTELETSLLFFNGDFAGALKQAGQGAPTASGVRVAALVMLGQIEEAEAACNALSSADATAAMARYFLGVGFTRVSRYKEARTTLAKVAQAYRHARSPSEKTFAKLAIAFFRFFTGEFATAARFARAAEALARDAQFLYAEILALDLFAHASVASGAVREGLSAFRRVIAIAEPYGAGSFIVSARVSLAINEAAYGIQPSSAISKLKRLRRELITNTYSQAEINLELIRQLTLRGQATEARTLLEETYELVHRHRNRRQAALLNLRAAYLQYLEGDAHRALHLVRVSQLNLHAEVDVWPRARLTGLEDEILTSMRASRPTESTPFDGGFGARMRARRESRTWTGEPGDDPLGDLIDRLADSNDASAPDEAAYLGVFTLVRSRLKIAPGAQVILTEAFTTPKLRHSVLIVDRAEMRLLEIVSPTHRKLLGALSRGPRTKADLITEVWGYDYDPQRHDSVLYSAIKTLRQKLAVDWLHFNEEGYEFAEGVEFRGFKKEKRAVVTASPAQAPRQDLNHRQLEVLEILQLGSQKTWKPAESREKFAVSTMTATRDLSDLEAKGIVRRIGKGRATAYALV